VKPVLNHIAKKFNYLTLKYQIHPEFTALNSRYIGSLHLTILRHNHIAKKLNYLTLKFPIQPEFTLDVISALDKFPY
jgi:hypothetical protein